MRVDRAAAPPTYIGHEIALTAGAKHWPNDDIIPEGYSELRTGLGRIIHTQEKCPEHGEKIPREVFSAGGKIALQDRDTRTAENPKGKYRTGKDLGVTYWEGPGSVDIPGADSAGGGKPVRGPYNPNYVCSVPEQQRLEITKPHYSTVLPR